MHSCSGKTIAMETEQLDSVMFGSPQGPAHPVAMTISGLESKISAARKVLDGIAVPRLSKCRKCLTFHLLRHRCQSLTSALSTLTSSTAQLPPIGHSLQSANSTLQRYTENNQKLEVMYHFYEDSLSLFVYPLYSVKMPFVD